MYEQSIQCPGGYRILCIVPLPSNWACNQWRKVWGLKRKGGVSKRTGQVDVVAHSKQSHPHQVYVRRQEWWKKKSKKTIGKGMGRSLVPPLVCSHLPLPRTLGTMGPEWICTHPRMVCHCIIVNPFYARLNNLKRKPIHGWRIGQHAAMPPPSHVISPFLFPHKNV